jgi:phosphoribosyl 1,2-cyclic phosphodiesterase
LRVRVTILGSGSEGNALLLESSSTRVLVDAGLSYRRLVARFQAVERTPPVDVSALIITHAHADHATHSATYANRLGCPVRATASTMASLRLRPSSTAESFPVGRTFRVGDIAIRARKVPHDAHQVALRFEAPSGSAAIVTDLGHVPAGLASFLDGCELLLLESNHDAEMLRRGPYPHHLKQRVGGPLGHLSNAQASDLLASLEYAPASVVLMHLSETNNTPHLARCSAEAALGHNGTKLYVAQQRTPTTIGSSQERQLQLGLYG